ncbi:MAG: MraY family glycosyltransferase [Phycisphaerae bacterium]|jgi:UDP-GlcNAc:undecaprenyl-phosphate GlcNAc-1-phosphate transferase
MKTYIAAYLGAFLLAVLFTPAVIWFAHRLRLYDGHNIRKVHKKSIPRIGGAAIFLSTIALITAVIFINNTIGKAFEEVRMQMFALLGTGVFIFFVGLFDDVRGLRARYKLAAQVAAALVVALAGVRITTIDIPGIFSLNLGLLSFPVTILWIVGITNAMNLIDGLDGLAAGIAAIACGAIAVFSIFGGQVMMAVMMLAMLGSLCGFLIFNFNPARIFMGDCGSMFLGFLLAGASITCSVKSKTVVGLALAALALGVPIFDMAFAMLRRYLQGRRIMSPDRSHLHHLLLDLGVRQKHIALSMYIVTAMAAGAGLLMMLSEGTGAILIFVCAVILQILLFRIVGAVKLRWSLTQLREKYISGRQREREVESYEEVELYFQRAKSFETWWHAVCFAAESMDFSRVKLPLTSRDGTRQDLIWQKNNVNIGLGEQVEMTVPVRDRRAGGPLQLNVGILTNNSLESAGHRAVLLTKLIERYGLSHLTSANEYGSHFIKDSHPVAAGAV